MYYLRIKIAQEYHEKGGRRCNMMLNRIQYNQCSNITIVVIINEKYDKVLKWIEHSIKYDTM